jgi:hypothetical protein
MWGAVGRTIATIEWIDSCPRCAGGECRPREIGIQTCRRVFRDILQRLVDAPEPTRLAIPERAPSPRSPQAAKPPARGSAKRAKPANHTGEASVDNPILAPDGAARGPAPPAGPPPSPAESPSPVDGAGPAGPQVWGFDIDAMNRDWALVLIGDKARVYMQENAAAVERDKRFLTLEAFDALFRNRLTQVATASGHVKTVTWAKRWLEHLQRRTYRGLEFWPNPDGEPGTPGYLNLWSGFSVQPAVGGRHRYATFYDHLLNNVCDGREDWFRWVFAFFAHIVQRPRERIGVALVLRGGEGYGKTIVGEVFGNLFAPHYFLVDNSRYLTGHFNAHQAACLLLQSDEAIWAGDHAVEGRLKGLITSKTQFVELKGVDQVRMRNFVRVLMTSNLDWVVPAGEGARRYAVFDVNPRCAKNLAYFGEMVAELDNGGRAALLSDLLAFDLSSVRLREVPRTAALAEQKIRSFSDIDAWWHERLDSGSVTRDAGNWPAQIAIQALYDDYVAWADRRGIRRKVSKTELGMRLHKLMPGLPPPSRLWIPGGDRPRAYRLPSLDDARIAFCRIYEVSIEDMRWNDDVDAAVRQPDDDLTF